MASKLLDENIECPICHEVYEVPKQLPCLHTFCHKCLQKLCEDEDEGDAKPCPVCRREFTIPVGGVNLLIDNQLVARLVREKKLNEGMSGKELCELCIGACKVIDASAFCLDCRQYLCAECKLRHAMQNSNKAHSVVDAQDKPSDEDLDKLKTIYCKEHENKELELYCCYDKEIICLMCSVTKHSNHNCKDLREIANISKKNIDSYVKRLEKCRFGQKEYLERLNLNKKKLIQMFASADTALRVKCQEYHRIIDEREKELAHKLNAIKEARLNELAEHTDCRNFSYAASNSFLDCCRMVLEQGTNYEIVKSMDNIQKTAEELIKSYSENIKHPLKSKFVKFEETCTLKDMEDRLTIGRIREYDISDLINRASVEVIQLKQPVCRITVVNDEIFVAGHNQSQVNVYDSRSLTASRDINIPNMKSPVGLAGCAYNKALYISDKELECIHRVDLTNYSITRWGMRENHEPRDLSVTAEHTLLVTVRINDIIRRVLNFMPLLFTPLLFTSDCRVEEYSCMGEKMREIIFDDFIMDAFHTVQLSSNQFIVCHGGTYNTGILAQPRCRVSVINTEGQIINSYRGVSVQLNRLYSLARDHNSGYIFVADNDNHKVLLLDSDLTDFGQVHITDDSLSPHCLYYDSSTDRLFTSAGGYGSAYLLVISPS